MIEYYNDNTAIHLELQILSGGISVTGKTPTAVIRVLATTLTSLPARSHLPPFLQLPYLLLLLRVCMYTPGTHRDYSPQVVGCT